MKMRNIAAMTVLSVLASMTVFAGTGATDPKAKPVEVVNPNLDVTLANEKVDVILSNEDELGVEVENFPPVQAVTPTHITRVEEVWLNKFRVTERFPSMAVSSMIIHESDVEKAGTYEIEGLVPGGPGDSWVKFFDYSDNCFGNDCPGRRDAFRTRQLTFPHPVILQGLRIRERLTANDNVVQVTLLGSDLTLGG